MNGTSAWPVTGPRPALDIWPRRDNIVFESGPARQAFNEAALNAENLRCKGTLAEDRLGTQDYECPSDSDRRNCEDNQSRSVQLKSAQSSLTDDQSNNRHNCDH